jgi:subtilisin family serine protease
MSGHNLYTVLFLLATILVVSPVVAISTEQPIPFEPPRIGLPAGHEKISDELLGLVDSRFLLPNQSRAGRIDALSRSGRYVKAGQRFRGLDTPSVDLVGVYVRTTPGTGASAFRSIIHRVLGEDAAACLIAAWVAPNRLLDLANLSSVKEIRPIYRPRIRTGSVSTVGDTMLHAAQLRAATGLSGEGVKVGVISDGVDSWETARASGDLPATIQVLRNQIGGDEGTAMLEIIHDIAPNASLAFHDCGLSVLEFNEAIDALAEAGCTVIVDDVGWIEEPFFEDGIVAAHVDEVVINREVVFVSATGNDADLHYQGTFYDDGGRWHDFSSGTDPDNQRLYVEVPPGDSITVILQWNEPFGAASSNFDLSLYNTRDLNWPLATGSRDQNGDDDPMETLTWINNGSAIVYGSILVRNPASAPARILELFVYPEGGASFYSTNSVKADSIYGHPAASRAVGVAAIDATDPSGSAIEYFSSRGPVTISSPSVEIRQKPDCSGVDGIRVTGAGSFYSMFWGTSAAAPHAAGIAALVWSGRPDATAEEIRNALASSADDLGSTGRDTTYGGGRLNATAMHEALSPEPPEPFVLPGRLEAEDYDTGGEGTAYHDSTQGNSGGAYRQDDVDIETLPEGGYDVGWIRPDEWLRYTVNVSTAGPYSLRVRGAAPDGGRSFELLVDGATVATVPIEATGSFGTFGFTNTTVNLPAGTHALVIELGGYFNLDYLDFSAGATVVRVPGASADPRDLDGDGMYEDVNGNGRRDFADVVLFFNQMSWIAANEPMEAFDNNINGRIDFADVTRLFEDL